LGEDESIPTFHVDLLCPPARTTNFRESNWRNTKSRKNELT
jgi:hypothetical protein